MFNLSFIQHRFSLSTVTYCFFKHQDLLLLLLLEFVCGLFGLSTEIIQSTSFSSFCLYCVR